MPAHRRKGDAHGLRELSGPMGPLAQQVDDPPAVRIGERGECQVEAWCAQLTGPNLKPVAFSISSFETSRTVCEKVQ